MTVRKEIFRFLVVGFTTVAIDFCSYRLLLALGAPYAPGKAAGFVVGTVFAYFANRFWTFAGQGVRPAPGNPLRFAVLYATTLLCNVAANSVLLSAFSAYRHAIPVAFLVATALSATLNFLGMKYLVFRPHATGPQRS